MNFLQVQDQAAHDSRQSVPPIRFTGALLAAALTAALGGFLFGFDTAVIAGAIRTLTATFALTPATLGITVSSALWGTIGGSVFAGYLEKRWDPRDSLRVMASLYLVSAIGCAIAWSWPSLLIFRIIGGVGIGGSSVLAPMYIAEVSPPAVRGRLVGLFQVNIVVGVLLAYVSNYGITRCGFGQNEWRIQLGASGLPSVLFLLLLLFIVRSPRWLVKRNRTNEARAALIKLGYRSPHVELATMIASSKEQQLPVNTRLFIWKHRLPIFLGMSIAFFSQLSGINAVLYYMNDIFEAAGFSKTSSGLHTIIVGVTNLVLTVLAMCFIDRLGRRMLLLAGSVGMAATLGGIAYIFGSRSHTGSLIWLMVAYCASFSFSIGAVMWVYIREVFPISIRAQGQSLASMTHWCMNALISAVFPIVAAKSKSLPFWIFSVAMAVQFLMVLNTYPETKGIPLELTAR